MIVREGRHQQNFFCLRGMHTSLWGSGDYMRSYKVYILDLGVIGDNQRHANWTWRVFEVCLKDFEIFRGIFNRLWIALRLPESPWGLYGGSWVPLRLVCRVLRLPEACMATSESPWGLYGNSWGHLRLVWEYTKAFRYPLRYFEACIISSEAWKNYIYIEHKIIYFIEKLKWCNGMLLTKKNAPGC